MSGDRRIHVGAHIDDLLARSDRALDGILSNGFVPLSASAARETLEAMKAEGRTVIRCCGEEQCPEFDEFGGGCPGHSAEGAA